MTAVLLVINDLRIDILSISRRFINKSTVYLDSKTTIFEKYPES
jgi:hypothetical protein